MRSSALAGQAEAATKTAAVAPPPTPVKANELPSADQLGLVPSIGETAEGLYPEPADLTHAAQRYTPGELFWILKNGIKMSGMPSWSDHNDEELWGTVAFLEKLPAMSEADYGKLIMESMKQGGRHGHGDATPGMDHSSMPGMDHGPAPHGTPEAPKP